MKDKIAELVEEKMQEKDLKFLSNKDKLINEVVERYCRDCQLKKECNICKTVRNEVIDKIKQEIGEKS